MTRAMRIVADHSRGAAFLIADGVVPSNEDRGYILRRIMRRAIQQGRTLGLEAPWLGRFAERTIELMGDAYPELVAERETIARWVGDEEESFGRTLERGTELLERLVAEAKEAETSWIDAADAFKLHDTYGFPYDLTKELLAEQGLSVDDGGFEELMEEQRQRARTGAATAHGSEDRHERVIAFAAAAPPTRFVGYETLRATTGLAAVEREDGRALVKLEESPFYAEGGGQVADSGVLRWDGGEAKVVDVYRVGEDQALEVEPSGAAIEPGAAVEAEVDRETRHATMRNHTATHLLHAALRERLGTHVRQAGSAVRPDKLRFDFTHGQALERRGAARRRGPGQRVDQGEPRRCAGWRWSAPRPSSSARWPCSARNTASGCGWSRSTASRASSAAAPTSPTPPRSASSRSPPRARAPPTCAGSRRSPARPRSTGSASARSELREVGELLGTPQDPLAGARRAAEQLREAGAGRRAGAASSSSARRRSGWSARPSEIGGVEVVVAAEAPIADQKQLLDLANRVQSKLGGDSAVVLGGAEGEQGRRSSSLVSKDAVERGLSAGDDRPRGRAGRRRRRRRPRRHGAGRRQGPGEARRGAGGGARGDRAGAGLADARPRPRPRHRPDRLRALRPERHPGDAAAGDRAAGAARGRRAGRRARGRAGRRRPAAAPQRRGGQPGGAGPQLLRRTGSDALDVPVETYDERLTTRMAEASRRDGAAAAPRLARRRPPARGLPRRPGRDRGARR